MNINAKRCWTLSVLFLCVTACTTYSPLSDRELRVSSTQSISEPSVTATFLGNSTILISDGDHSLLVDGFFSRPSKLKTLFWKIGPNEAVVKKQLKINGIKIDGESKGVGDGERSKLDAILVGHSHYDHALDTIAVARVTMALVMANKSYANIHERNGGNTDSDHLLVVPKEGMAKEIGKFVVKYIPSNHVSSQTRLQRMADGNIENTFGIPAHYTKYKRGEVFAIHVSHPDGNILVTTTVGAKLDAAQESKSTVVFLAVGRYMKETPEQQSSYWEDFVTNSKPDLVIPVHWDDFTRKLSKGLAPFPWFMDNVKKTMDAIKGKLGDHELVVLDQRETVLLRSGKVSYTFSPD